MSSNLFLVVIPVVVLAALVVLAVAIRGARSRARQALPPASAGPMPTTGVVCSFCKRRYDPAESGDRCPGCGAAAPRRR